MELLENLEEIEIEFSRKYLGIVYFKEKNEGIGIYKKIWKNILNLSEIENFINEIDILNLFGDVGI